VKMTYLLLKWLSTFKLCPCFDCWWSLIP